MAVARRSGPGRWRGGSGRHGDGGEPRAAAPAGARHRCDGHRPDRSNGGRGTVERTTRERFIWRWCRRTTGARPGFLRQPGHRFFYAPEEVELLAESQAAAPVTADESGGSLEALVAKAESASVLIAGIGNIFLGDDGFGVEVLRRLASASLPSGVRAVDFGIRSLDLTYALMDAPDVTILVDACSRGEARDAVRHRARCRSHGGG